MEEQKKLVEGLYLQSPQDAENDVALEPINGLSDSENKLNYESKIHLTMVPSNVSKIDSEQMELSVAADFELDGESKTDNNVPRQDLPIEGNNESICKQANEEVENYQFENHLSECSLKEFFVDKTVIELARYAWPSGDQQNFLRGCIFSPDGMCVLTAVNNDGMHIVEMPTDLYQADEIHESRPLDVLQTAVHVKESGTVYDLCWYPFMHSSLPETCFWLSSRQHEPIQIYDAFSGGLRCSYRGYDHVDEVEAAISVLFSPDGQQIFGGYKKALKIFQTNVPGRDFVNVPLKAPAACLAFSPQSDTLIAIGSWNRTITMYDLRTSKPMVEEELFGHKAGVTWMKFESTGDMLWSGARRDNQMHCWDLRNSSEPLHTLDRAVSTNQRIYFDISNDDKWLISGSTDGKALLWDLNELKSGDKSQHIFPLHHDCCNGVSMHATLPVLATSSGQHHFRSEEDCTAEVSQEQIQENSLIFWWHGKKSETT